MAGLVTAIHVFLPEGVEAWMPRVIQREDALLPGHDTENTYDVMGGALRASA
jgi:hypothetical protein